MAEPPSVIVMARVSPPAVRLARRLLAKPCASISTPSESKLVSLLMTNRPSASVTATWSTSLLPPYWVPLARVTLTRLTTAAWTGAPCGSSMRPFTCRPGSAPVQFRGRVTSMDLTAGSTLAFEIGPVVCGHHEHAEKQRGIEVFNLETAVGVGGGLLAAIGITVRAQDALALFGAGGVDEDHGAGERGARLVLDDAGQVRALLDGVRATAFWTCPRHDAPTTAHHNATENIHDLLLKLPRIRLLSAQTPG